MEVYLGGFNNLRIGFYAPLKSPYHGVASGDRQVARNFLLAFEGAGFSTLVVSDLRVYLGDEGDVCLVELERLADLEFERIRCEWESDISLIPDLLFCYHVYYKSPDLLLSRLSRYFSLPYVIAEASYSGKRFGGVYARGHFLSSEAIIGSDLLLQLNAGDGAGLRDLFAYYGREVDIISMSVFGDFSGWQGGVEDDLLPRRFDRVRDIMLGLGWDVVGKKVGGKKVGFGSDYCGDCIFIVSAMMRAGDKFRSYEILSESLLVLIDFFGWRLVIIGDGVMGAEVRALFSKFGDRVHFTGFLESDDLFCWLSFGDIYVWPAVGEAFGVSILEAVVLGLGCLVGDRLGVRGLVDGKGGILCLEGDVVEFSAGLLSFYNDYCCGGALLEGMKDYNLAKGASMHGLDGAIAILEREFSRLVRGSACH